MNKLRPMPALTLFYLLTPIFWLLDAIFGWSFRVAGLDSLAARSGYYLGASGLGVLLLRVPSIKSWVALIESGVNVTILFVTVASGILLAPEAAWQGESPQLLNGMRLINFLISGSVLSFAVHQSIRDLRTRS
jgi:hypothetical protein